MAEEKYIEYEVQLRVNDLKFMRFEKQIEQLNSKLNFMQITIITGIILPRVLNYFKII